MNNVLHSKKGALVDYAMKFWAYIFLLIVLAVFYGLFKFNAPDVVVIANENQLIDPQLAFLNYLKTPVTLPNGDRVLMTDLIIRHHLSDDDEYHSLIQLESAKIFDVYADLKWIVAKENQPLAAGETDQLGPVLVSQGATSSAIVPTPQGPLELHLILDNSLS